MAKANVALNREDAGHLALRSIQDAMDPENRTDSGSAAESYWDEDKWAELTTLLGEYIDWWRPEVAEAYQESAETVSEARERADDAPGFDAAMERFLDALREMQDEYFATHFPHNLRPVFYGEAGPKYVRIVRHEGPMDEPITRSAFAFIERSTGNILKTDSWKRPAKHPRGNIFNDNPLEGIGPYGVAHLREARGG